MAYTTTTDCIGLEIHSQNITRQRLRNLLKVNRLSQFQSGSGNVTVWKQQWLRYIDTTASKRSQVVLTQIVTLTTLVHITDTL